MTKPITPERVQRILGQGEGYHPDDKVRSYDFKAGDEITWGELRVLLAAHGRECVWKEAFGCWDTTCGRSAHLSYANFCPYCGGKVKVEVTPLERSAGQPIKLAEQKRRETR